MNYENMTKEELVSYIEHIKEQRAFSYEDQIKLAILDKSPFTIWASDRECKIRLWDGQCESMYGRSKEEVLGKDFVDLFVARDEQAAARRDQLEIIDRDKVFHNIANDQGRNGNTLKLITHCFRIRDPKTGEYWNAEIGVTIDYYEEEQKQLAENIAEGRLIQSCISQFRDNQRQYQEQFIERKEVLLNAIRVGEREAAKLHTLEDYRQQVRDIKEKIKLVEIDMDTLFNHYYGEMCRCTSHQLCESVRLRFIQAYNDILSQFDDLVLEFEIVRISFIDKKDYVSLKDSVMKDTTAKNTRLANSIQEIWIKAESNIKEYRGLGDRIDPNSEKLKQLTQIRDRVNELKTEIGNIASEIYYKIGEANSEREIECIKNEMEAKYTVIEQEINNINKSVGG